MIFDSIEHLDLYSAVNYSFKSAKEFILREDLKSLEPGKYEIDGDTSYAIISNGPGRRKESAKLETHKKYIDIQYVIEGTDTMAWKALSACEKPIGKYDNQNDVLFFEDTPSVWIAVNKGEFAVFFPSDAHLPLISSGNIHKVVIKIAV